MRASIKQFKESQLLPNLSSEVMKIVNTRSTLPMLRLPSSKHTDAKILDYRLNPVMLVFIRKLLLNTLR